MSRRAKYRIIPAARWGASERARGTALLLDVLQGVGDGASERLFRMQVTLCMHRALAPGEVERLPSSWHTTPARDLAGGPVHVYYTKGLPAQAGVSAEPCRAPRRAYLGSDDPDVWLPQDCGVCPSCEARAAIVASQRAAPVERA